MYVTYESDSRVIAVKIIFRIVLKSSLYKFFWIIIQIRVSINKFYKYACNMILIKKDININQDFKSYYKILCSLVKYYYGFYILLVHANY